MKHYNIGFARFIPFMYAISGAVVACHFNQPTAWIVGGAMLTLGLLKELVS